MPEYSFAVISALLWAISAPILNKGLQNLPDKDQLKYLVIGLYVAMLSGVASLLPFAELNELENLITLQIVLAGIFTFPLATGVYYASGIAFNKRMELASQFAKVKPVLSAILALYVLKEVFTYDSYISFGLISVGVLLMLSATRKHGIATSAVVLGVLTAVFWALGEMWMKLGIGKASAIDANLVALLAAVILFSIIVMPTFISSDKRAITYKWLWPFVAHGIISFGFAYAAFFHSIQTIGLGKTVLINAFWPLIAIIVTGMIRLRNDQPIGIPPLLWISIFFIILGSVVQAISLT